MVALLLTTTRPLTLDEIADEIGGYPDKGESRRAAFERDKKTLRAEGVPLDIVAQHDGGSAYRIDPDAYYLPPLDLTDDERVALNLAVAAVALDGDSGRDALWKLGEGVAEGPSVAMLPTDDGLIGLFDAWRRGAPAHFSYRGGAPRELHVWGVAFRNGRWYTTGFDATKNGERLFRVDRIDGEVTLGEDRTATPTPAGYDLHAALPGRGYAMYPSDDVEVVLVDMGAGCDFRPRRGRGRRAPRRRLDSRTSAHHEPRRVPVLDLRLSRSRGCGRAPRRGRRLGRRTGEDGQCLSAIRATDCVAYSRWSRGSRRAIA